MRRQVVLIGVLLATAFSAAASFDGITAADIAAATLTTVRIDGSDGVTNQLTPGTIVLYQTDEGRYGKLQVLEYGYDLRIQWVTFRPDGTPHTSGELVVHGTWYCDLDAGREGPASADFQWHMVSSTERYLEPANGARFALCGEAPPPGVHLATDKGQYTPGETISFTLTIPVDCNDRILVTQPDGSTVPFAPDLSSAVMGAPGWITIHQTGTTGALAGLYTATLLCDSKPQTQVQYVVGPPGVGVMVELAYDDGTAEATRGTSSAGLGYAVRFTPPASGGTLIEARFFIMGFSPGGAGPIEVRVWDASRNLVGVPMVVTPTEAGWLGVDLASYGFAPSGDFYVGYVQLSATAHPWIGLDTSGGEGRSYHVPDWEAVLPEGANIMIRAVLSSSPAGSPPAGTTVSTNKPLYALGETIVFTVTATSMCVATVRVEKPDGSTTTQALGTLLPGQTVSFAALAGMPLGPRTVQLYCGGVLVAQTTFSVGTSGDGQDPPPVGQGTLQLTSTPSGVQVYIDGVYRGVTPLTVGLAAGTHTVTFRLAGYPDITRTVTIQAGATHYAQAWFGP